jgi:hypothetical protein
MAYFDCCMVGAWMFAIGWFLGAVYMQNHDKTMESPRVNEEPEPERHALRFPVAASAD